ncbi:MAG: hypothetical protein CTY34_10755 [Methylobacter sp.]|nr:MAG: hypothetical protein CTY34_10755 [Methylobacter sp.]PPD33878.1 MAG: hypothetical protein CTY18_09360 [Methylomonas sp.]
MAQALLNRYCKRLKRNVYPVPPTFPRHAKAMQISKARSRQHSIMVKKPVSGLKIEKWQRCISH